MVATSDFQRELQTLYEGLETLSYYDYLSLRPSCDYVALRDAFYERAQRFHPDRFVASEDAPMRELVYAVYKRMTEAYNVLSDPQLRRAYDEARLAGDNRLSDVARTRRLSAEERQVGNMFARIYLRSGRIKLERDDVVGAWIDCQLGLSLEDAAPLRGLEDAILRHPAAAEALGEDA